MTNNSCLIAMGSNMAVHGTAPAQVLDEALVLLSECGFVIRAQSRYYATPAYPPGSGPDFVNAAVAATSPFDAARTLEQLHGVEAAMGRTRAVRWGARTLDLDLLAMGAQVLPDIETHAYWRNLPLDAQQGCAPDIPVVPHPRMAERAFVLVPLLDVAADWWHPVTGQTVRQMHDALPAAARQEVVML